MLTTKAQFVPAETQEDIEYNRNNGAHEFIHLVADNGTKVRACKLCGADPMYYAHDERFRIIGAPAPWVWD